eukprot:CAMPEP_0183779636 /NCGR_PEP_ID=MMETSP0739-20130205/54365_1 /TAXON_ID=385413 /ORGANISM="Thalassiosira miniscula, Strain CCMP1093" /LENGTH=147 /DNA_ID=CAMNT_0026022323 /DNA_START=59 /DNA_END=498 /DNA_ORIENTATION=+
MIVRPNPKSLYSGSTSEGEATQRFFTQRQSPSLATITASAPVIINEGQRNEKMLLKLLNSTTNEESEKEKEEPYHVYINIHPSHLQSLPLRYHAGLWSDTVEVVDVGDEAANFVAKIVTKDDPSFGDVRVVAILESSSRTVNERYCP